MDERQELLNFADLVERMREAQKRYFQTRKGTDLGTSKQLERTVDVTIEIIKGRTLL
jgi:Na+/phosphate symporter